MKKEFYLKSIAVIAVVIFLSGCASSTLIQSDPPGAKVYINGQSVGKTPYLYTDTKVVGSTTNIDLVKEGYQPLYASISRDEQVNVGAIIGGFICWVPFLWTMEYNPTHNYELIPLQDKEQEAMRPDSIEMNVQTVVASQELKPIATKAERLKELKQLLDDNLITKDDYEKQKQKILNEI